MPVIRPVPGAGPELARALIALADDPHEVAVTTDGGLGFVVSRELEQRWITSVTPAPERAPEPPRKGRTVKPTTDVSLPDEE